MSKHYRKHSHGYDSERFHESSFGQKRRDGFGMNLYRNTKRKKIAGVCAGLADHLNVDRWIIRLTFIAGFLFFNSLALIIYAAAWIILVPRPKFGKGKKTRYRYDEAMHEDRPVNMFSERQSASERLKTARTRMQDVVDRTTRMERYVTSKRYELDKEFSKIQ